MNKPPRILPHVLAAALAVGCAHASQPRALERVGALEHAGITMDRLRFDGPEWQGQPVRVYGLYAAPEGEGPHPAVLQVHGGGQTCYPQNVAWFVERGYACLAIDWGGQRDSRSPDEVTAWPQELVTEYYALPGMGPESSMVHLAAEAGVAAIDVLASLPEVDPSRIGVQGVSWGGQISWNIAARDKRVRTLLPVYGVGGLMTAWNQMGIGLKNRGDGFARAWTQAVDPISFPGEIHCPVLLLNAANDYYGQLPEAEALLGALSVPAGRSLSPNRMHSLDPGTVLAAEAWLDAVLRKGGEPPSPPRLSVSANDDGTLRILIEGAPWAATARVDFSRDPRHPIIAPWLSAEATPLGDGVFAATVPLVDPMDELWLMGQAFAKNGAMFTTPVWTGMPKRDIPGARGTQPTTSVITDWGAPDGGWFINRGTDFFHATSPVGELAHATISGREAVAYAGEPVDRLTIDTRALADAAREKGNARALEIWLHDAASARLDANATVRLPEDKTLSAELPDGGHGWVRHVVRPGQLRPVDESGTETGDGDPLASWNETYLIQLVLAPAPGGQLAVGRLAWVDE